MKKTLVVLMSVALFASCGNSKKEVPAEVETTTSEVVEAVANEHNAANSLDYEGTYKGTLPTASGEGMQVTISLEKDNKFSKEVLYVGKETTPTKTAGVYKWDTTGSIITLEGEVAPNQYFVGENTLTQLDVDGNKITGAIADQYILKK